MYEVSTVILTYIPWVIGFFYCILTPLVALADRDKLIYPLFASVFFSFVGIAFMAVNVLSVS